jgi:hypothetical protein
VRVIGPSSSAGPLVQPVRTRERAAALAIAVAAMGREILTVTPLCARWDS